MDGKGGDCCVAKYGGGGGCGGDQRLYGQYGVGMSKVDRIMLKFRPIAPKPVAPGGSTTENCGGVGYVKSARRKRKYVRVNKNKDIDKEKGFRRRSDGVKTKKMKQPEPEPEPPSISVSPPPVMRKKLLPLLPETPDRKESGFSDLSRLPPSPTSPGLVSFNPAPPPVVRVPTVVSYVTVECVTDTCRWVDWEALGCTDEEIVMNMEKDTCPGFITDGQDTVVWSNKAYRQLINDEDEAMAVVLVRKDKRPEFVAYPAFTCKVRVTFAAADSHRSRCFPTLTLPCDVWRMDGGNCAWRLDVKAALSLGR